MASMVERNQVRHNSSKNSRKCSLSITSKRICNPVVAAGFTLKPVADPTRLVHLRSADFTNIRTLTSRTDKGHLWLASERKKFYCHAWLIPISSYAVFRPISQSCYILVLRQFCLEWCTDAHPTSLCKASLNEKTQLGSNFAILLFVNCIAVSEVMELHKQNNRRFELLLS